MEYRVGWKKDVLSDFGEVVSGGTPKTKVVEYWGEDISWITPADLSGYSEKYIHRGRKSITHLGLKNSSAKLMSKGSVLFSSRAPIGYVAIAGNELCTNQGFKSLIPNKAVNSGFLYYYFKSIKQLAEKRASGTAFKELSGKAFADLPLCLPPLSEQRAIVSKIEQLFSKLDNGISNLKLAQEQLKVYRQAVLKKAFEGGFIKGITAYKDVKINGVPAKIPFSWKICKIGDYAKLQGGFAFKSKEYISSGIPIVKISNVYYENIDWTDKSFISEDRCEEFKEYSLDDGDILIAMTRPVIKSLNTVKTVVVSKKDLPALLNQRVGRFKISDKLSKEYLKYFIYTDFFKKQIIEESSSTQQPNISSKKVEDFDFIFPDDTELQHIIVQEIETRLSVCDKIEQDIETNLEKAEALRQSILKKAFEGKLLNEKELAEVRGAEDWEPAEVLLERIKAEKSGNGKKVKQETGKVKSIIQEDKRIIQQATLQVFEQSDK